MRVQALLGELDLPSTLASLQDVALHLHAASAAAPSPLAHAAAAAGQHQEQLQHLVTLADAAVQRIADLAEAAAADAGQAAGDAAAPKDNGWLQPLVTGLETVLAFIEVRPPACHGCLPAGLPATAAFLLACLPACKGSLNWPPACVSGWAAQIMHHA
jgi:hypothetical protein